MVPYILSITVSLLVSAVFLLLCTEKKKKKSIKTVSYTQQDKPVTVVIDRDENGRTPNTIANSPSKDTPASVKEKSNSKSASLASLSRELPELPSSVEDSKNVSSSRRSSSDCLVMAADRVSEHDLSKAPSTPKTRRLPTPPPDGTKVVNKDENNLQDNEDMYAIVDDAKTKVDPRQLKVRTLDIAEGSGDSTFYAKVSDNLDGDTGLYAQVGDDKVEEKENDGEGKVADDIAATVVENATLDAVPQYATVDKLKKGVSIKIKENHQTASAEPPAPPIPERNFDGAEEQENGNTAEEQRELTNENRNQTTPTYDKVIVRESLDHLRLRQEAEEERKHKYSNLPSVDAEIGEDAANTYSQIDEANPEALYESLSQPGSADGTFQLQSANDDTYSSIEELNTVTEKPIISITPL